MAKKELVFELTPNEFPKVINDKKTPLVIVDFFATWCFPCTMMAPVFQRLAEKNPSVKFAKIDVDDASDIANEYEVSSIPCIVFFKEGHEVDRIVGGVSEDVLEEKIGDYLKL